VGLGGGSGPPDIITIEIEESRLILLMYGFKYCFRFPPDAIPENFPVPKNNFAEFS